MRDLINLGYTKCEDGRQLYELPLVELEDLYKSMRTEKASKPIQQVKL
ncbi:Fur-regulated basic protein FbpA [Neobacillus sp. WH10]|nr:Fur-regulated basic protein FbpA [Neobacillus sp. WH10]WHY80173.1 Fur-regulated basic protein FbpA [Neobacillus sp. WH10]